MSHDGYSVCSIVRQPGSYVDTILIFFVSIQSHHVGLLELNVEKHWLVGTWVCSVWHTVGPNVCI